MARQFQADSADSALYVSRTVLKVIELGVDFVGAKLCCRSARTSNKLALLVLANKIWKVQQPWRRCACPLNLSSLHKISSDSDTNAAA